MPILKSALKKLRQTRTKSAQNKVVREKLRSLVSAFRKKPSVKGYPSVVSVLAKAAKTNVIHKNKAARLSSRLAKLLKK